VSELAGHVENLLSMGAPGAHPAGAVVGVRTATGASVEARGWAVLPGPDSPGVPMSPGILLDLASVTKVASTTVLVMRLVADGEVRLDDAVRTFLPAFDGEGKADITLRHLLTHTAGLRAWWPLYLETTDRDAAVDRAQKLPLATAAGSTWLYSDLGLILAGAVVERVTALDLAAAYRTVIAEPLGLTSGYGPVAAERAATSADSDAYEYRMVETGVPYPVPFAADQFTGWRDRPLRGEANDGNAAHALGGVAGHAGLFSSVDDLLTLGAAVRGGEFIASDVLDAFAAPTPVQSGQAVGFRRAVIEVGGEAITVLRHGGFTGTSFAFALEKELVVAGAATRLYGTVGPLPRLRTPSKSRRLVTVDAIQNALLDVGADALRTELSHTTTQAEDA
jgi:serine-type D-Ala-D-Ala carboxypeptidase